MKLEVNAAVLEEARFAHIGQFLARPSSGTADKHDVHFELALLDIPDPDKAVVRLKVTSGQESQYSFAASYLLLLRIEGERPVEMSRAIAVTGGMMLMPFLRECIANLTMRGRFGPVWLPAMNFTEGWKDAEPEKKALPKPKKRRKPAKRKG